MSESRRKPKTIGENESCRQLQLSKKIWRVRGSGEGGECGAPVACVCKIMRVRNPLLIFKRWGIAGAAVGALPEWAAATVAWPCKLARRGGGSFRGSSSSSEANRRGLLRGRPGGLRGIGMWLGIGGGDSEAWWGSC